MYLYWIIILDLKKLSYNTNGIKKHDTIQMEKKQNIQYTNGIENE